MTPKDFCVKIFSIEEDRKYNILNLCRLSGELINCLDRAKIPEIILNTKFNRGLVALGGLSAAGISIY